VAERVVMSYADAMTATIIRPATVCGYSPRMRLDIVVNLLTMQALTNGTITVFGGDQTRPNIHIDDIVDVYLFALERRLAGVYNAGFENLTVREIAAMIAEHVPAEIKCVPSNDPRSYAICSDRLLATGFRPAKNVATAIGEMVAAYRDGRLTNTPEAYNVNWMKLHHFG
jgi:nucleoside-diphosphate-sugar epimerase